MNLEQKNRPSAVYGPRTYGLSGDPNAKGGLGRCGWSPFDDFHNDTERFNWAVPAYQTKWGRPLSTRVWSKIKAKGYNCQDSTQGIIDSSPPSVGDVPVVNASGASAANPQVNAALAAKPLPVWAIPAAGVVAAGILFFAIRRRGKS